MSHNEAAYPQASIKPLNLRSSSRNPPAARTKVSPEQSSNSEPERCTLVGVSRSGTMASRPRYPESGNTLGRPRMPDLVSRATSLGPVNNNSDDDLSLCVALPGALKAQKTIRSTARKPSSRNLSTHFPPLGGSRPSTFSRTAPVSGSRSRAPSRPDTGSVSISSVPSPDDLSRRLVQLQTSTGGANTLEIPRTHTSTSTRVPRQQHHERSSRTGLIPSSPGFDLSNSRDSSGTPRSRKASVTPRPSNIMDESSFDGLPGQSRSRPSVTDTSFPSANNPIGIDRPNIRTRSRTVDPKIRSPVAPPLPSPTSILPPPPLSPGPSASGTKDRPASWINFLDLGAKPVNLLSSVTNETSEEPSHKKRRSPPRQTPWQLPSPPSDGPGIPPSGPNWKIPVKLSNAMAAYREEALVAADISDEQRIFVETKQKSCVVKIGVRMRARDVMEAVLATGRLHGRNRNDRTNGGGMLFDMVHDLALGGLFFPFVRHALGRDISFTQRRLREYEMITEVFATWNKNNSTNCLIVKRSGLCDVLALNVCLLSLLGESPLDISVCQNMPTSSPINHGVVQRKSRRGKWSKRSLRLCEQCLFISKKDHVSGSSLGSLFKSMASLRIIHSGQG